MLEVYKLLIGIGLLILGVPIGNLLAKFTKDELKQGKKWFRLLILLSCIGAVVTLILGSDTLMFTFLFIAIVTSRNLR